MVINYDKNCNLNGVVFMPNINLKVIAYTSAVTVIGVSLIIAFTIKYGVIDLYGLIFMAVLSIIAESLSIFISGDKAISVGFAITLSALLSFGPVSATWVITLGALLKVTYDEETGYSHLFNTPLYKVLFNVSNYIISCLSAGGMYIFTGGKFIKKSGTLTDIFSSLTINIIPIVIMILTFMFVNFGILTILFRLLSGKEALTQFISNLKWIIPNLLAVACLGIIITIAYNSYGPFAVILFFGPLILARYSFKLYIDMKKANFETVKALTAAVEAKDKYTEGHSRRVAEYVEIIAKEIGLTQGRIDILKYAALLHDIGKIGIPEAILNKPDGLTESEFEVIKQHPVIGYKILEEVDFLQKTKDIVRYHHERYDGCGYPDGLKGNEIPLESRIMAVADSFDAMTSERPYRGALSAEKALSIIAEESGRQFSPEVVDAFQKVMEKSEEADIHVY